MKSEEINLKELNSIRQNTIQLNKDFEKELKNDKIKEEEEKIDEEINIPLINYRQIQLLSESIINYFSMGICFFIYGCYGLKWFNVTEEENNSFYLGYFLIGGIILYLIGIINWYEGKELISLINFIFAFLFMALFLKNQNLGNVTDYSGKYNNDKLQGIFYILFFCFIFVIGISSKQKGIIFIIDKAVLFVSYVFLFAYKFFKNDMIKKIGAYFFIVCSGLYWITGTFKFFNDLIDFSIVILEPSD